MTRSRWAVRLSDAAQSDFDGILRWTAERFGKAQAEAYAVRLTVALASLDRGPEIAGVRQRDEIRPGPRASHMGRRGRHIILFRVGSESDRATDVSRIPRDAMDLSRHARPEDSEH